MRKPMPRTSDGKYTERIQGIEEIAIKTVEELCALNSKVDIIDIDYQFSRELGFQFMRKLARESLTLDLRQD